MGISAYACRVVGEDPERAARWHASTIRRTRAFAVAIHIPVLLWAVSGYLIAAEVFHLPTEAAIAASGSCALLIYLVERLVLATPKAWHVNTARLLIGTVAALLGASAVDLVVFDREISQQLRASGQSRELQRLEPEIAAAVHEAEKRNAAWLAARSRAECEANGTCGTKQRSVGPVYRELKEHSDVLRTQYEVAYARVVALKARRNEVIEWWRSAPGALVEAGLLARVEALHRYTMSTTGALLAWILFFVLVLSFELVVVLVKLVFSDTVDDELEEVRETVARQRAVAYREAMTSPVLEARQLLQAAYR